MNAPPLSPSTPLEYSLFSPSKAAQQQRLAKDWTYIHSFLASKYPFPLRVPKFEENEETLRCLLQLAAWNEKGNEGWRGMCGIEEMCLRGMEEEEGEVVSLAISFDEFGMGV
jgi:HAUS augmin-like complex subunit 1